jgi:predicted nucleic acid-binding protein
MCLNHFARVDRLDVLRDLLIGDECWTTYVVLGELRRGVPTHPDLQAAIELEWVRSARLESVAELECFAKWADRIGAGERNLGEASVFAVAELCHGTAITDDQPATRVARRCGLEVHGTVWLLARACRNGKLTVTAAGNLIDMLRATDMRLPFTGPEFESWVRQRGLL